MHIKEGPVPYGVNEAEMCKRIKHKSRNQTSEC